MSEAVSMKTNTPKVMSPPPFWVTFAAGGISGTAGAVVTNPLEVVKTRMQSSMYYQMATDQSLSLRNAPVRAAWTHVMGTMHALRSIYQQEGLTALWRGTGPTLVGVMPARAIHFSSYTKIKHSLIDLNSGKESSWIHLSAAAMAGIITSTATNPIWLVKTRMQLQSNNGATASSGLPVYRNSFHCLVQVGRTEGLRGVIEGTVQWVLYEKLKGVLAKHRCQQLGLDYSRPEGGSRHLSWVDYFVTAASAKLVAAMIAYPHEVLRTRLREETGSRSVGLLQLTRRILQTEGVAALYGGLTPHLIRVVPNSAIMFFCYECILHGYNSFTNDF